MRKKGNQHTKDKAWLPIKSWPWVIQVIQGIQTAIFTMASIKYFNLHIWYDKNIVSKIYFILNRMEM